MTRALAVALLATCIAAPPAAVAAQDPGLVQQGRLLANAMCAECHTFAGDRRSDRPPPDLRDVGAMAQTTPLSLRVFLRSPHASMPDLILEPGQIDALSAFILERGGK